MTSSQVNTSETPPMTQEDLKTLAKNETDENGLILGKFKSVEDLAASYRELEGKLGSRPKQEETTTEESTTEETETETPEFNAKEFYGEGLAEVLTEAQIDPQDISNRFQESGKISEDDYTKLEGAGFSRQVIDTYLNGLKGGSDIPSEQIQSIKDSVGGDDNYTKMTAWATQNLSSEDADAFNKLTETGDTPTIRMAVQGLYSQYTNAMGVEPNLVTGKPSTSGPSPYRSTAEVVNAMKDPRYGKDVTYTEDVQNRLGNSDVFTTR